MEEDFGTWGGKVGPIKVRHGMGCMEWDGMECMVWKRMPYHGMGWIGLEWTCLGEELASMYSLNVMECMEWYGLELQWNML
jgi:hypothetical protein